MNSEVGNNTSVRETEMQTGAEIPEIPVASAETGKRRSKPASSGINTRNISLIYRGVKIAGSPFKEGFDYSWCGVPLEDGETVNELKTIVREEFEETKKEADDIEEPSFDDYILTGLNYQHAFGVEKPSQAQAFIHFLIALHLAKGDTQLKHAETLIRNLTEEGKTEEDLFSKYKEKKDQTYESLLILALCSFLGVGTEKNNKAALLKFLSAITVSKSEDKKETADFFAKKIIKDDPSFKHKQLEDIAMRKLRELSEIRDLDLVLELVRLIREHPEPAPCFEFIYLVYERVMEEFIIRVKTLGTEEVNAFKQIITNVLGAIPSDLGCGCAHTILRSLYESITRVLPGRKNFRRRKQLRSLMEDYFKHAVESPNPSIHALRTLAKLEGITQRERFSYALEACKHNEGTRNDWETALSLWELKIEDPLDLTKGNKLKKKKLLIMTCFAQIKCKEALIYGDERGWLLEEDTGIILCELARRLTWGWKELKKIDPTSCDFSKEERCSKALYFLIEAAKFESTRAKAIHNLMCVLLNYRGSLGRQFSKVKKLSETQLDRLFLHYIRLGLSEPSNLFYHLRVGLRKPSNEYKYIFKIMSETFLYPPNSEANLPREFGTLSKEKLSYLHYYYHKKIADLENPLTISCFRTADWLLDESELYWPAKLCNMSDEERISIARKYLSRGIEVDNSGEVALQFCESKLKELDDKSEDPSSE